MKKTLDCQVSIILFSLFSRESIGQRPNIFVSWQQYSYTVITYMPEGNKNEKSLMLTASLKIVGQ